MEDKVEETETDSSEMSDEFSKVELKDENDARDSRDTATSWTRYAIETMLLAGFGWFSDGMESQVLSFLLPVLQLNSFQLGLVASVISLSQGIGAMLVGRLADIYGRRIMYIGSLLLSAIFGIVSSVAIRFNTNIWICILFRCVVGFFIGANIPLAVSIIAESISKQYREPVIILMHIFYEAGELFCIGSAYLVLSKDLGAFLFFASIPSLLVGVWAYFRLAESSVMFSMNAELRRTSSSSQSADECYEDQCNQREEDQQCIEDQFKTNPISENEEKVCLDNDSTDLAITSPFHQDSQSQDDEHSFEAGAATRKMLYTRLENIDTTIVDEDIYSDNKRPSYYITATICAMWFTAMIGSGYAVWINVIAKKRKIPAHTLDIILVLARCLALASFLITARLIYKKSTGTNHIFLAFSFSTTIASFTFAYVIRSTHSLDLFYFAFTYCFFIISYAGVWPLLYVITPFAFPSSFRATGLGLASASSKGAAAIQPLVASIFLNSSLFSLGILFSIAWCSLIVFSLILFDLLRRDPCLLRGEAGAAHV